MWFKKDEDASKLVVFRNATRKWEVILVSNKRNYRRSSVNKILPESLRERALELGGAGTTVGLDVAKHEIVVVVRWDNGTFERPWSVKNPDQIEELIERLSLLRQTCDGLIVALESTGTYSEAIRHAMTMAKLTVHRVSGKAVADYKEIFDGVPSQHDGKDAAMIAELTAFGKGTPWPYTEVPEDEQQMRHWVLRADAFRTQANQWTGRVEGLLAKHWPELNSYLELNSATLLKILIHYGTPAALASDTNAANQLRSWGRGRLVKKKIDDIIESARTTRGIPPNPHEMNWIQEVACEVQAALAEVKTCEKSLRKLAENHQVMKRYVKAIGPATLCVIWTTVGDPAKYSSSGAFLKALGLNLKELSSGKRQGQLGITKRGPSLARKLLYYWALRGVQQPELRQWYTDFQKVGGKTTPASKVRKIKGLVALMRKLCRSFWYVRKHDLEFDYAKVLPGRPLDQPKKGRRKRSRRKATV